MGQRVNIQYSVELDELENEVNRLYKDTIYQLENAAATYGPPTKVSLGLSGVQTIDHLRQKLARIDIALSDIQNIVQGYVHYSSAPSQDEPPATGDLQEKLAKFKEIINENANQEPTGQH